MNRGVLQSSPVQQMVTGNPNWWSLRPPQPPPSPLFHQQINPQFLPPNSSFFIPLPNYGSSYGEVPADQSWSQLLMGGLVSEEEIKGSNFQAKKLENWEEQERQVLLLDQATPLMVDVKQELNYLQQQYHDVHANNNHEEDHHQFLQTSNPSWSPAVSVSSPKSCTTVGTNNMLDFSSKIADNGRRHPPPDRSFSECNCPGRGVKKARAQSSSSSSNQSTTTTFKVRKEKIGDRITALHQLVSPFGKTDTASVLLEAIGYIRFLQSQIEALSLPYITNSSSPNSLRQHNNESQDEPKKDLRSRGLCLVPVSCTLQVGSDDGADFWAPAIEGPFQ